MTKSLDLAIPSLGERRVPSPLLLNEESGDEIADFVSDEYRLLVDVDLESFRRHAAEGTEPPAFEKAGPRKMMYFDPTKVRVAIVTCGGLCPGVNNVIRSLVMQLWHGYGVRRIVGVRFGFRGFIPEYQLPLVDLDPEVVSDIHMEGGTVLGSSRGEQSAAGIVDMLERQNVNVLFTVGGDGTMRGALGIQREVDRRGLKVAVVGVPKTIDNDIPMISRTFGFDTAVDVASVAIRAAHAEATGAPNGVGVVKLMGRHSGYIAASAALACRDVNLVLVPEQRFDLRGDRGVLAWLRGRLAARGHAVIVVAEGAGQEHLGSSGERDASGNLRLLDIGTCLVEHIRAYFASRSSDVTVKYIDPGYIIRATPANSKDAMFCGSLAANAVHAAMAGKTGMVVGLWHEVFTHVPLPVATGHRKLINLEGDLWRATLEATGQPPLLRA